MKLIGFPGVRNKCRHVEVPIVTCSVELHVDGPFFFGEVAPQVGDVWHWQTCQNKLSTSNSLGRLPQRTGLIKAEETTFCEAAMERKCVIASLLEVLYWNQRRPWYCTVQDC